MQDDKTLQQTLAEIQGEQGTANSDGKAKETDEGISDNGSSEETQSGETSEYVSGVSIKDIPEQDRPRIRELLKKKADLLEKGYQPKFQEVSRREKELAERERVVSAKTVSSTQEKKEAVKLLDQLIETSPLEQKPALEQMRKIIKEETNSDVISKRLDELEGLANYFRGSVMTTKTKEINQELNSTFTEELGKEFIEKNRDEILKRSMNNPNVSLDRICFDIAPDEYKQALLAKKMGNKKTLTKEKINAISSSGENGVSVAKDNIDTNKSWKGFLQDLTKK